MGTSWTRERSAAVSAAGEGSDEIGVWRGPRVVGMESKAAITSQKMVGLDDNGFYPQVIVYEDLV